MININSKFFTLYQILIYLPLLISCAKLDDSHPIKVEEGFVNQQILIVAPDFLNTFNVKDSVYLEIKYLTNNEITFSNNYNLRMFSKIRENWVEIYEIPTERLPAGDIVLSPDKVMPAVLALFVVPDLPDLSQRYELRIYIMGNMKINDAVRQVFAYVDVALSP